MYICAECGKPITDDNIIVTMAFNGVSWDEVAYHKDCVVRCAICGEYIPVSKIDSEMYHDEYNDYDVCLDCYNNYYVTCTDCGATRQRGNFFYTSDTRNICRNCSEYYYICDDCGALIDIENDEFTTDGDRHYCSRCSRRNIIHNYSYDPEWHYCGVSEPLSRYKDFLYGVELEVDKGDDSVECAYQIQQASNDVYMKHDGSLTDDGFEIISHPATLDYHLNKLGWDKISNIARQYNYISHNAYTCGIHIHIGLPSYLNGLSVDGRNEAYNLCARVCVLVDHLWESICKFARRIENRYNIKPNIDLLADDDEYTQYSKATDRMDDHHMSINYGKANTLELRMFRGSLNVETIKATIIFTDCLMQYCRDHNMAECIHATFADVVKYSDSQILQSYLKRRGLLD